MDSDGFEYWLQIWYNTVKSMSEGPWCLIMDNCGGHEVTIEYDKLTIIYLSPGSTAKHQPLELGLISHAKIRYRSALLSATLDIIEQRRSSDIVFPSTSGNGKYGVREGHVPHVADAVEIFNKAWSSTKRITICKFWIKSECLGFQHSGSLKHLIQNLVANNDSVDELNSTTDAVIGSQTVQSMSEALACNNFMSDEPRTPLHALLDEVSN